MKIRIVSIVFFILSHTSFLLSQFTSPLSQSNEPDSTVWAKRLWVLTQANEVTIDSNIYAKKWFITNGLDAKADLSHTQIISSVTGMQDSLTTKLNRTEATTLLFSKAASAHIHAITDVTAQADTDAAHITRAEALAIATSKVSLNGEIQWTTIIRSSDTTYALNTAAQFVNLGQLEFNMDASGFYEIECRIFTVRATAANAWTLAMNFTQAPTNLALQAIGSNAAATQTINMIDTYLDSLQMIGTTVTTGDFPTELKGFCVNAASTTGFKMRWHCELPTNVTIKRGSWLRYRKYY